jgi:hypothetical protein
MRLLFLGQERTDFEVFGARPLEAADRFLRCARYQIIVIDRRVQHDSNTCSWRQSA